MKSRFLVLGSCASSFFPVSGAQNETTPIAEEGDQTVLTAGMFSRLENWLRPKSPKTSRKNHVTCRSHDLDKSIEMTDKPLTNVSKILEDILKMDDPDQRLYELRQLNCQDKKLRNAIVSSDIVQQFILNGYIREAEILMKTLKGDERVKFSMPMIVHPGAHARYQKKVSETDPQTGKVMEKVIPIREAKLCTFNDRVTYRNHALFLKVDSILLALSEGLSNAKNSKYQLDRDVLDSCFELMKFASAKEFSKECDELDVLNVGYRLPIMDSLLWAIPKNSEKEFKQKIAERIAELNKKPQERASNLGSIDTDTLF